LRAYCFSPLGANHNRPSQHGLVRRALFDRKGQDTARFDMSAGAGIGDDRRGAEWAFGGVNGRIEFKLGAAIGAFYNPSFLDLVFWQLVGIGGVEIQLA